MTEWKNTLRWFKLVVLFGTCPMLGLSQYISKCGIISVYTVNCVLLHPRSFPSNQQKLSTKKKMQFILTVSLGLLLFLSALLAWKSGTHHTTSPSVQLYSMLNMKAILLDVVFNCLLDK